MSSKKQGMVSIPQVLQDQTTLLGLHDFHPALSGMLSPPPENAKTDKKPAKIRV